MATILPTDHLQPVPEASAGRLLPLPETSTPDPIAALLNRRLADALDLEARCREACWNAEPGSSVAPRSLIELRASPRGIDVDSQIVLIPTAEYISVFRFEEDAADADHFFHGSHRNTKSVALPYCVTPDA